MRIGRVQLEEYHLYTTNPSLSIRAVDAGNDN